MPRSMDWSKRVCSRMLLCWSIISSLSAAMWVMIVVLSCNMKDTSQINAAPTDQIVPARIWGE
jgi:hypothetical protein